MENIINYINDNAILASLITLVISTIIQILFTKSNRKYNEKQESKKEFNKQFQNKGEFIYDDNFKIDDRMLISNKVPIIDVVMSPFRVKISKDNEEVKFYYSKKILDLDKYDHFYIPIKNIGNADINELNICAVDQKEVMLTGINNLEYIVNNNSVSYSCLYDKKILKNQTVLINLGYINKNELSDTIGCDLLLVYKDSFNNIYKQILFICDKNTYPPKFIDYDEYMTLVMPTTAIECFKNPWMW